MKGANDESGDRERKIYTAPPRIYIETHTHTETQRKRKKQRRRKW